MGLQSSATVSAEVGREVAVRQGLGVFVEGSVASAGTGYIITAAIRGGSDGRTLGSLRESAAAPDQVIAAIDRLSGEIRAVLGETVGTIRTSFPLERVTTPSLEALTLYSRAVRAFNQFDDRPEATRLLQNAVIIDPGFAMAWRMLGVTTQGEADQALRLEAVRQAYDHRDRLSELERYTVEASYFAVVERDRSRAGEALLRVLSVDPQNQRALNNLGVNYVFMGELELAEEALRRAIGSPGASSSTYRNLVDARISLGRVEEASKALDELEQKYPEYGLLPGLRAQIQFLSGEVDEARTGLQRVVDDPLQSGARRADAWAFLGALAYWEGKHEAARRSFLEAERVDAAADAARVLARVVESARTAALVGDVEWARSHIETQLGGSLPADVALDRSVIADLTEVLALTFPTGRNQGIADELARSYRISSVHARIQSGDTLGVRTLIGELPLSLPHRALLFDRLGDKHKAIELYEEVGRPGYTGWGSVPALLRASMRLGPLYEETGDTVRAVQAYREFSQQWADGDRYGRMVAERFSARALSLEAERTATLH
jgi:tetratricopeptide (TPR) repeat protein